MPDVIFVEAAGFVGSAAGVSFARDTSRRVVALSAAAEWALRAAGVPYVPIDAYCHGEFERVLSERNLERALALAAVIDGHYRARVPLIAVHEMAPGRSQLRYLKALLDVVWYRIEAVRRALEAARPGEIVVAPGADRSSEALVSKRRLYFDAESVYGRFIPLVAASAGVACHVLKPPVGPPGPGRPWRSLKRAFTARVRALAGSRARPLVAAFASRLTRPGSWRAAAHGVDRPLLFVLNPARDIRGVIKRLLRDGRYRMVVWNEVIDPPLWLEPLRLRGRAVEGLDRLERAELQAAVTAAADAVRRDPRCLEIFRDARVDWCSQAWTRLDYFLISGVCEYIEFYLRSRRLLEATRPAAVLFPGVSDYVEAAIVEAAQHLGIPRVAFQRGGVYGYSELHGFETYELPFCDHFLTYGPGVTEALPASNDQPHAHVVGSPRLDTLARSRGPGRVRNGRLPARAKVLYITTQRMGQRRILSLDNYADCTLFAVQRTVMEALAEFPQHDYCVKFHPTAAADDPLFDLIAAARLPRCRVSVHGRLERLVRDADLCLLDHPSTSLLECLVLGRAVLVYAGTGAVHEDALRALQKDAAITADLDEFRELLRGYLSGGPVLVGAGPDSDFLHHYGTVNGDGRSVQRSVAAIDDIVGGRPLRT